MIELFDREITDMNLFCDVPEDGLITNNFTNKLDEITIIDRKHEFVMYLAGFMHRNVYEIRNMIHFAYYSNKSKTLKILLNEDNLNFRKIGIMVSRAWNTYNASELNTSLYSQYLSNMSEVYSSNDYSKEERDKYYLKYMIDNL
jgi:hypothetical protein